VVVYSRSLDGGATLVVRGAEVSNDIRVALSGGRFTVSDSRAPVPAANVTGCEPTGSGASCPADASFILIDGGPGNDRIAIDGSVPASIEARLEGGTGADELYGGNGSDVLEAGDDSDPDTLDGGGGDDALVGARTDNPVPYGSGKSLFYGGQGADVMVGGDPCDGDVFDGGPGNDNANFFRFTPGVNAEIGGPVSRDGGGCTPGRIDRSVEALEGSPGPDVMIGSAAGDSLIGKGGDDQLFGRAGDDILSGGPGNDRLVGGPGNDIEHQ
jgi:Ca2+-binding RTX toxin-like protein